MKELVNFIEKGKQEKFLELFMILTELNKTEDIISFTYDKYYLTVRTGVNDYYRIHLTSKEVK
jgi:hypothetical protein